MSFDLIHIQPKFIADHFHSKINNKMNFLKCNIKSGGFAELIFASIDWHYWDSWFCDLIEIKIMAVASSVRVTFRWYTFLTVSTQQSTPNPSIILI